VDGSHLGSSWFDDPNLLNNPITGAPQPDHNYAVRLSDYAGWINGVLPDGVIPEPASLAILAAGAAILLVRRRRRGKPTPPAV
jgi:hypothetical protein